MTQNQADRFVASLRVGEVDITPSFPVHLAANAKGVTQTVADPLFASVWVIEVSQQRVALISLDLLYPGEPLTSQLRHRLQEVAAFDAVLVFATHTHSAPTTDPTKPVLGTHNPEFVTHVADAITTWVAEAMTTPGSQVHLGVATDRVNLGVNRRLRLPVAVQRRRVRFGRVVPGPNPKGAVDDVLTVVTARGVDDDRVLGVLWNFACHPVGHPCPGCISAHFPGLVRERLRESLGAPVLFLQGFSGDIRPDSPSANRPQAHGWRRYLSGPGYSAFTEADYQRWVALMADHVERVVGSPPGIATGSGLRVAEASAERGSVLVNSDSAAPVRFASLALGDDVRIVGVSMEAVCDYAAHVRYVARERWVLPAGCMGDVAGYAPTAKMLKEGGYEVDGFCPAFSCDSVAPTVEETMLRGLDTVSR